MNCPNCGVETERLGSPQADGSGDVYTYEYCHNCDKEFEIVQDELNGGEPTIREV